ncbi:MAG TPA: SAM-dependent chlorinase/fluorinase [Bacteroidales bacterium]|nr:SAM-dependent chlorinase/fluorinase [Bacteroidales bacterium]
MVLITLLSDWGTKDHYAGIVKGKIYSRIPGATVVDLTHNIPPFNLNSAAFVLRNSYSAFPEGTIHIVDITSEATIEMPHVLAVYDGSYFIGADNGVFSLAFDHKPEKLVEIDIYQDTDTFTFAAFDVFVKVAQFIVEGNDPAQLGHERKELTSRIGLCPVTSENLIKGHVTYIDQYENIFTNISRDLFAKIGQKRPFRILFGASRYSIKKISQSYKDVPEGEIVALFSSSGYLQLAVCMANAAGLLGLRVDDTVRIEFV